MKVNKVVTAILLMKPPPFKDKLIRSSVQLSKNPTVVSFVLFTLHAMCIDQLTLLLLHILESEDEGRVVKSQKDRKWDSMKEGIVRIRNARKNSDWPLIQDEFAAVNKMVEKSKMIIIQSGLPKFYVKMLVEVEDHVQLALKDKEAIKKMKPVVSRALNQMKLQVRKHNETYKAEVADCRANPDKYQEEEEAESSSSSESSSDSDSDSDSDASGSDSDKDSDASYVPAEKPKAKVVAKKEKVNKNTITS